VIVAAAALAALGIGLASAAVQAVEETQLDVHGMTFVASRGDANEIVLRAREAQFRTNSEVATLEEVRATVAPDAERVGFDMTCERGELHLDTNDFYAEGNVAGETAGGRRFETDWVRYDHGRGLLFTDAPVTITERSGGTFKGGGFEYFVAERRFRLLGGASVVQEP